MSRVTSGFAAPSSIAESSAAKLVKWETCSRTCAVTGAVVPTRMATPRTPTMANARAILIPDIRLRLPRLTRVGERVQPQFDAVRTNVLDLCVTQTRSEERRV